MPLHSTARVLALTLLCFSGLFATTSAAADSDKSLQFEADVAPIFAEKCVRCHSQQKRRAELDLSSLTGALRGGESGEVIVAGKPDDSLLVEMLHSELMPPEDEPQLSPAEITTIEAWIQQGAKGAGKAPATIRQITNHDIEPLLLLRCAVCHGLRKQEGGLDLRTRESLLRGGESGPAIVLGSPEKSLLLQRIHREEMPPRDRMIRAGVKPIEPGEIAELTAWIRAGAPEIDVSEDVADGKPDPLVTDEDRSFWAFRRPTDHRPPAIKQPQQMRNAIDAFLLARLEERSLTYSPAAGKRELARRLHFDLTGLPPSPQAMKAFLKDSRPDAYERLVDRLLASPRHGERWARFWLDLAGYADSEGKRSADPIRPYAYKYRDYVIRSFNSDKPYSRFLLEQLAGDELADYRDQETLSPELADNLVATGFLRMAPDGTGSDIVNSVQERLEVIGDEIEVFSSAVLALTVKCARCHSHKYDPIPQRDYYRLAAVFKGALDEHDWLKPSAVPGQSLDARPGRVLPLGTRQEIEELESRNQKITAELESLAQRQAKLETSIRQQHQTKQLAALPEAIRSDVKAAFEKEVSERTEVEAYLVKRFQNQLTLTAAQLKKTPGYQRTLTEINRKRKSLEGERKDGVRIRALWDRGEPSPTYIYIRGDYRQTGRLVGPGVLSVLTDGKAPFAVPPPYPGAESSGRRLALAKWLTEDSHPLTARVMVNRIWKQHFGRGIVESVNNFGKLGASPTHPQLLDWLAIRFIESGWSLKAMHRLMVTSAAYRQTSRVASATLAADPANVWLSRMPLRRLDAEEVRDSLLQVAGRMAEHPFGRPDAVTAGKDGLATSQPYSGNSWRRSIYVRQRRKEIPTILETFDLPQMNPNCQIRVNSIVAQQALHLMNDPLVRQLAGAFASRVRATTADEEARIRFAYEAAYGRPADDEELQVSREALAELRAVLREDAKLSPEQLDAQTWSAFCHMVLNAAEFLYID